MTTPRSIELDEEVEGYLVAQLAISPGVSYALIAKRLCHRFPEQPLLPSNVIKAVRNRNLDKIEAINKDPALAAEMAMKIGLLPLCDRLTRLQELHHLYYEARDGYEAEVFNNRGEVNTVTVIEKRNEAAKILAAIAGEYESINPAESQIRVHVSYGDEEHSDTRSLRSET